MSQISFFGPLWLNLSEVHTQNNQQNLLKLQRELAYVQFHWKQSLIKILPFTANFTMIITTDLGV